jgi:GDPmannose 4,6-dehydratase
MRKAIITGITGQDGAYLAQLLLGKGYEVIGTFRRTSSVNFWRLQELGIEQHPGLQLVEFDLTDLGTCMRLIAGSGAEEIYNLAAQSFVGVSFEQPRTTAEITGLGAVNLLEAIRNSDRSIRFYQASTSEMFGKVQSIPQGRKHAFLSAQSLRGRQAVCPLDDGQLPRELRHLRKQRHPVQPRIAASWP